MNSLSSGRHGKILPHQACWGCLHRCCSVECSSPTYLKSNTLATSLILFFWREIFACSQKLVIGQEVIIALQFRLSRRFMIWSIGKWKTYGRIILWERRRHSMYLNDGHLTSLDDELRLVHWSNTTELSIYKWYQIKISILRKNI